MPRTPDASDVLASQRRLSDNPLQWGIINTKGVRMQENVFAAQAHLFPELQLETTEAIVAEALCDGKSDDRYFLNLLVRSGSTRPMEMDNSCGKYLRPNRPGDMTLLDASHPLEMKGTGPFHSVVIITSRQAMLRRMSELADRPITHLESLHASCFHDSLLKRLLLRLYFHARLPEYAGKSLDLDEMLHEVCGRLLFLAHDLTTDLNPEDRMRTDTIQRVVEYMRTYRDSNLTIAKLAEVAGMSRGYFSRLFRQTVGVTPKAYLTSIRIDDSMQQLVRPELAIREVAIQSGFYDSAHFCREFKNLLGITPLQYRGMFAPRRTRFS